MVKLQNYPHEEFLLHFYNIGIYNFSVLYCIVLCIVSLDNLDSLFSTFYIKVPNGMDIFLNPVSLLHSYISVYFFVSHSNAVVLCLMKGAWQRSVPRHSIQTEL